jgi:hypothetical protein
MIPHKPRWDFSIVCPTDNLQLVAYVQLQDGRLCGARDYSLQMWNMTTRVIETTLSGHTGEISGII